MTTFETAAVSLLRRSSERITARANRRAQHTHTARAALPAARRLTLTVGALASFTYAASTWHEWAAFVVGGLSALWLEQSFSDD